MLKEPEEKAIIVNATALDQGGALSILKQFIENVPTDRVRWCIFISDKVELSAMQKNLTLIPVCGVKSMIKRLWWDFYGLNKWLKKHSITPIATISLQNTGFRVSKKDIPKFIYLHQSIPFYQYKWNVFKKEHRTMWFYKNVYPFFIRLFLTKKTIVFVQLNFIKEGFIHRFKHDPDLIYVFSPSFNKLTNNGELKRIDNDLIFFYPATNFFYKNHKVIVEALKKSDIEGKLYLTISETYNKNNIIELGSIPFNQVCSIYRQCDCLLYPSYIESYGLPLLEAASIGVPIIAADLPYAREVLNGYHGVIFVNHNDIDEWANAINKIKKDIRYTPICTTDRPSWKELIEVIKKQI